MKWDYVNLINICTPKQWKTISQKDLLADGKFAVYGANGKLGLYNEYNHETPVLLIGCRGSCGSLNITEGKCYTNGNAMACDNLSDLVDIKFLFYYLTFRGFDDVISGGVQPQITREGLSRIQIPLPPLPIQKRIAEILDAADALRKKDQELLKKYDELAQAIFIDMFGDPVKNEKGWEVKKLGDVCNKITDGEHGTVNRINNGKPYLMARNIRDGFIDFSEIDFISEQDHKRIFKRCNPEKGDLFLVCVGATIGRVCLMENNDEYSLARSVALIKPNLNYINSNFLLSIFKSDFIQIQIKAANNSSAQAGLYTGKIKEIKIPVPPIKLQNKFESQLNILQIQKRNISPEKSNSLFQSLILKSFAGKLVS